MVYLLMLLSLPLRSTFNSWVKQCLGMERPGSVDCHNSGIEDCLETGQRLPVTCISIIHQLIKSSKDVQQLSFRFAYGTEMGMSRTTPMCMAN